jgi:SAM-dependent methyltransferase
VVPLALERIPAAAQMAQRAGVPVIIGCLGALPLRPASVDIVLASQVMHHLDRDSALRFIAACNRVARRGVVLADLHPRWFAAPGLRLAGTVLRFHRTTIDDGITSIRRGYTSETLRAMCQAAGVRNVGVAARRGARIVAWWKCG